ncbi:MAG TPA: phenylalanine--tRNA ligase subunit beta [Firmicutes bacterium]|nr:phenylalanine--tRNA ligase subunit beta [Bacillota bacterium]
MKVSLNWLRRYVDIDVPLQELCDKMVMSGFEVDGVEDLSATMDNVVAGRIVRLEKHPDADRLQICQLDVGGEEPVQIVTGADNVFEGALVPVALHDSRLPNGAHIKKGKLRGVASNGMLCSGEELCLREGDYPGAGVHGILILRDEAPVGTDMREVLGLNDVIIDFSVTANRPDCQSVLGIAREVAVALKAPFRRPEPSYTAKGGDIRDHIRVRVEDFDLCPRYYGRVVKNVRMGPSPAWMQQCLKSAGMRPISNIVDITNFVMLETGQPMHAFDLRDVRGGQIVVRRAKDGERMTTLDGKPHTLTGEMLVIADAQEPSCIAGVMGGLDSEIKDDTTDIFFEAAKFRRDSVRKTARALGMRTESSARFEKGVDILNTEYAMNRALQLIEELDAGDIIDGVVDENNGLPEERVLTVAAGSINALLGLQIPAETMEEILNRLQIRTVLRDGVLTCTVPSFRDDIEGRADLAEEVMRVYGYDHIAGTPMRGEIVRGRKLPDRIAADRLKGRLTAQGMYEITTYSFIAAKAVDQLGLAADDERRRQIPLLNPLGEEYAVMRTQLTSSMLTVLAANYARKIPAVRFFEVSKRFVAEALPLDAQPAELPALSIGLYGEGEDFFTLKGLVEEAFAAFGVTPEYERSAEPYLHPGRQAAAKVDGKTVAVFGELHPDTAERYGIGARAYTAEVRLETLYAAKQPVIRYRPLPRFPAVERDLALLCDEEMPVAEIEKVIRASAGRYLESVSLFDVYQGAQTGAGKKSVAYALTFRSAQETLTDQEIDAALQKIFKNLSEKGCILRS